MRSSTTVVALAAMLVGDSLAGPAHTHLHRVAHDKKDLEKKDTVDLSGVNWNNIDWKNIGVDWSKLSYPPNNGASSSTASAAASATTAPTAAQRGGATSSKADPAASSSTSAAAPSGSTKPQSATNNEFTGLFEGLWNNLEGCANNRKSFGGRSLSSGDYVSYISNVGIPYGSNMMIVEEVGSYDYTIDFVNAAKESMTINCWNKPGKDGQANSGATDAPKFTTLTFNLSPGQNAIVAVDENTVMACTEAVSRFDGISGAFATTWTEIKCKKNDSGYNVSKILNTGPEYKVSMSAADMSCVSSDTENNWITDAITTGSGSCYQPNHGLHLTIKMEGCH